MPVQTVFYSWQSDRPASKNRGFIERCLREALQAIGDDNVLTAAPRMDRDTAGVPGSPDIVSTIFDKIMSADVVVSDITFVDDTPLEPGSRRFPNPNVLIELGFAASCRGWDRIICIFNSTYGDLIDLPFDIRHRRIVTYCLGQDEAKATVRQKLTADLKRGIEALLKERGPTEAERQTAFRQRLFELLARIILSADEVEEHGSTGDIAFQQSTFERNSEELKNLADSDFAEETLGDELWALAELLDKTVASGPQPKDWPTFLAHVHEAGKKAIELKTSAIDPFVTSESLLKAASTIRSTSAELQSILEDMDRLTRKRRFDEHEFMILVAKVGLCGHTLSHAALFDYDTIERGLSQQLGRIGKEMRLIVIGESWRNVIPAVEKVRTATKELADISDRLPK